MKVRLISIIVLALSACFCSSAMAQTSIAENSIVRSALDDMFEDLDKSRVPTGYLLDYAVDIIDLSCYDGKELVDSNVVNRTVFLDVVRSIKSASVNSSASSVIPGSAMNYTYPLVAGGEIDVSVAAFKYNYIVANALTDGLIEYDESSEKVSDAWKDGEWQNPYGEANLLAFSPVSNLAKTRTVTYRFPSVLLYKNVGITEMYFDAGDGNGYRSINPGSTINATYSDYGNKYLKLKVKISSGEVLEAHSVVGVIDAYTAPMEGGSIPSCSSETCTETWNGINVEAKVTYYVRDGSSLRRPFIVVEGFDPWELTVLKDGKADSLGFTNHNDMARDFYKDSVVVGLSDVYDLVYIDWFNSTEDIRANAKLFRQILQKINQRKADAGSSEKNVVLGQSMGGLVARYALRTMELEGIEHETATYISHDTPHKGANVPLGALYFAWQALHMAYGYTTFGDLVLEGKVSDTETLVYNVLHSQAAKQMLINYVDIYGNLDNTVHNEWMSELDQLDFPEGDEGSTIQNFSIVNGRAFDVAQSLVFDGRLLHIDGFIKSSIITDICAPLLSFFTLFVSDFFFDYMNLSCISNAISFLGSSKIDIHANVYPLRYLNSGHPISELKASYTKTYLWMVPVTYTLFSATQKAPYTSGVYYDELPGSFYPLEEIFKGAFDDYAGIGPYISRYKSKDNILGEYSFEVGITDKFMFIPTASALAIKGNTTSDFVRDYYSDFPEPEEETYFDAYYLCSESKYHIFLDRSILGWIVSCLEGEVDGPEYVGKEPAQYSLVGSDQVVSWSTSNGAIATIDNTGTLTPQGTGNVRVIAESVSGGALYRKTMDVMVDYAPRIVMDYSYSASGGFEFTVSCVDADEQQRLDSAVGDGLLKYEWSILNSEADMNTVTTNSNVLDFVPETGDKVTIAVRLVDREDNKGAIISSTVDCQAIMVPNYEYVIVNSDRDMYFIKSDNTYDAGYLSENFTVALRDDIQSNELPVDLLNGGKCYILYHAGAEQKYMEGTRYGSSTNSKWTFPLFSSEYFLNAMQKVGANVDHVVINGSSGYSAARGNFVVAGYDLCFSICNSERKEIQKVPFSIIYKEEFPETGSSTIGGVIDIDPKDDHNDELHP